MPDPLLTTAEAAALVGVPRGTVANWKTAGLLTPAGWFQGKLVYREADVRACHAARLARPNYPKNPQYRAGGNPNETMEELEALIAHQMEPENLPAWWPEVGPDEDE